MDKGVKNFYDSFAQSQLKAGVHRRHISILQWLKKFGLQPNHHVLEIGCGVGTVTGLVLDYVREGKVVATDISSESIDIARKRLENFANVEFIVDDILNCDFSSRFDFVVLPDVLEHIPQERHSQLFKKIDDALKPDGSVFIHMPEPGYQEWLQANEKESLQIIDQPIHTLDLLKSIEGTSLKLDFLCTYGIWLKDPEFQAILLKKNKGLYQYSRKLQFSNTLLSRASKRVLRLLGMEEKMIPA